MASSRTDNLALLEELGSLYDDAFSALQQGEIDRIERLLDAADEILTGLREPDWTDDEAAEAQAAKQRAQASHGRLTHGMATARDAVRTEAQRARRGQKGLRGYGGRGAPSIGNRVSRDA